MLQRRKLDSVTKKEAPRVTETLILAFGMS